MPRLIKSFIMSDNGDEPEADSESNISNGCKAHVIDEKYLLFRSIVGNSGKKVVQPLNNVQRYCYNGSYSDRALRVSNYNITQVNIGNLRTRKSPSYQDYTTRCDCGIYCKGHFHRGINDEELLYPYGICLLQGNWPDTMTKAAQSYYINREYEGYKDTLRKTMLGKKGTLRKGIMGGTIEGSLRMVIVPAWDLRQGEIYLPDYLSDIAIAPHIERAKYGSNTSGKFIYSGIKWGDYAIAVRPPTLRDGSVQPMKIKFWKETCIGFSPLNCRAFHADFDGDELQLYFIKEPRSIRECAQWNYHDKPINLRKIGMCMPDIRPEGNLMETFMCHTTMSMEEVLNRGNKELNEAERTSRLKLEHMEVCRGLYKNELSDEEFENVSMNAISSLAYQKTVQGKVGYSLRMAKCGSLSYVPSDSVSGMTSVVTSTGRKVLNMPQVDKSVVGFFGFPCMRAVAKITSKYQQEALDMHRHSKGEQKRSSLISEFLTDGPSTWILTNGKKGICILRKPAESSSADIGGIYACYSPSVLRGIKDMKERAYICLNGIEFLCNAIGVRLDPSEYSSIVSMILHVSSERMKFPMISANAVGCNYRWLAICTSNYYSTDCGFRFQQSGSSSPIGIDTHFEMMAFCNFRSCNSISNSPSLSPYERM